MKYFTNKNDLVLAWHRQSHPHGRERCGLQFNGPALIHYKTLIAYRLSNGATLLNPARYSVSTSRVQRRVCEACHVGLYEAPLEGFEHAGEEAILKELSGEIVARIRDEVVSVSDEGNITLHASTGYCRRSVESVAQWQQRAHALIRAGIIRARSVPSRVLNAKQQDGETARQYLQRLATTVFRAELAAAECTRLDSKYVSTHRAQWEAIGNMLAFPCLTLTAKRQRHRQVSSAALAANAKLPLAGAIYNELILALDVRHPDRVNTLARCARLFLTPKDPARQDIERAAANPPALVTPPPFNATLVKVQLIANGARYGTLERALTAVEYAYRHRCGDTIPQASLVRLDSGALAWVAAPRPDAPVFFRF